MVNLLEISTPSELEEAVKQYCPCHETWNRIIESEKEMYDAGVNSIIAYKVTVSSKEAGLLQYSYVKGGFMKKAKIVVYLFTPFFESAGLLREVHQELIKRHRLSGELIHVVSQEEKEWVRGELKADGFTEHKNNGGRSKYGYEADSLYYVKNI